MLRMQPGPAHDTRDGVGFDIGERTPHQRLRSWSRCSSASRCCPHSAPMRLSTATARRVHWRGPALVDPLTLPATYAAPSVPAKAPRQGEGAFGRDGRELASDVRVKHDAAVVTVVRATLVTATRALVRAGDRIDALEELAAELAPGLHRSHWLILGGAVDARAAIELGLGQVLGKVDRVAHEVMAPQARGSRLLRLEHACPRLTLREWGRARWPAAP